MKKNSAVALTASIVILAFFTLNIILPDKSVSQSERRKLASFPKLSVSSVMNGSFFTELEDYALDQFPLRESFRRLKAFTTIYLLGQKDNNDLYRRDGNIYKLSYKTNPDSVLAAAKQYKLIQQRFLTDCKVYYSVIPDKNFFSSGDYPRLDYNEIYATMKNNLDTMKYIGISTMLSSDDFYFTDLHWRQERITDVADTLLSEMAAPQPKLEYIANHLYNFKGSYYGQWSLCANTDILTYLTNEMLGNAKVYDYETKAYIPIYSPEKFSNPDPYDVFLSGARALLRLENPQATTDNELFVFRDSFSSSLAPLLLKGYSAVTLIDLRYITLTELEKQITIPVGSDALFLYNTLILNNSSVIIKS